MDKQRTLYYKINVIKVSYKFFFAALLAVNFIIFINFTQTVSAAPNDVWKIPDLQIKFSDNIFSNVECSKDAQGNPTECQVRWIAEYVQAIYKYLIGIIGILAVVVMMFGGIRWIVAGGNAASITEAKAWIGASLTGLVLVLTSYTILYYINPNLISFKALGISMVKPDVGAEAATFTSGGNLNTITADITTWNVQLAAAARTYNLDCNLLKAFMITESSGNPNAISPKGAIGLMQIMPNTGQALGYSVGQLKDPATNIMAGAKYLSQLQQNACNGKTTNGVCDSSKIDFVIAAYNGGPGANKPSVTCPGKTYWQCEANSGYIETRLYVDKVKGNYFKIQMSMQQYGVGWGC
jgi:hypothetical protein